MDRQLVISFVLIVCFFFIAAAGTKSAVSNASTNQRQRRVSSAECAVITTLFSCMDPRRLIACPRSCAPPPTAAPVVVQTTRSPTTTTATTTTPTTSTTTTTTAPTPSTSTSTAPQICQDRYPSNCLTLAPACPADPLIQQLCPVTCGVCQPPSGLTTSAVPASPKAAGATPTSASPQPPSSSTATTTAATTSVASTMAASSRSCYQCGVGSVPCTPYELLNGSPMPCPPGKEYCTSIVDQTGGQRAVYKMCVDKPTCVKDWYQVSSDRNKCVNFDPRNTLVDMYCNFCCATDACNIGVKPKVADLYNPQKHP